MASAFHKLITENEPTEVKPLSKGKSGALIATYRNGVKAVIKRAKRRMPSGKKTQRDLSVKSQPFREVAFYELNKLLGFDLVPETVLTVYKGKTASAQLFIPAVTLVDLEPKLQKGPGSTGWRSHVIETCKTVPKKFWRQLLTLDIIGGARDRHTNNVGIQMRIKDDQPIFRLIAWDNATTFGKTFYRYHNVFHKLLFRKSVLFDDMWPVLHQVTHDDLMGTLSPYLSTDEVDHAYKRMRFFLDYPYRLPWKVCSLGHDSSNEFPPYTDYFENADEEAPLLHTA